MAKDTFLNRKTTLNVKGKLVNLSSPCVMGILNLTADSFYTNSRIKSVELALQRAEHILDEGGKFIDIGAYSSRPGAQDLTEQQEMDRIVPVVEVISKKFPDALISIDTFRAKIARETFKAGAHIINDISAGDMDESMFQTVADLNMPYVMMHMRGTPQTMQQNTNYKNLILEMANYFSEKVNKLKKLGVNDIIIDPGFGFAKTLDQNFEVLRRMEDFNFFELPILVGLSRKSMIYKLLDSNPEQALNGTTTLNTIALLNGANILRVHDVKAATECIALVTKMQQE